MEKWQEEILDKIENKDNEIIDSTSFVVNDDNLDFVFEHLFLLSTKHRAGRLSSSNKNDIFEASFIGFNKEDRVIYVRCAYFLYIIRNADIDLKEVDRGYTGYSLLDKVWLKDDDYYKIESFIDAKKNSAFVGRTVFNHRNLLTVLEKNVTSIDNGLSYYKFAEGTLEDGEFQFPIYKDKNEDNFAYAKTVNGHIFNVHSKSHLHPKGITSGACYLCTILNEDREIGLNVISKFGKVRSGLSVGIDFSNNLINSNRFNDIDPQAMECSNILEYFTDDEEYQEFKDINIFARILRDFCISLQLCEDKSGDEKIELLFANERTEGQDGKVFLLRHLPTSKNSPFIEFISLARTDEDDFNS